MKKITLFLSPILALSLIGCSNSSKPGKDFYLTYNLEVSSINDGLIEIDYNQLVRRMKSTGELLDETFLLLALPEGCTCREVSQNTMKRLGKEKGICTYAIDNKDLEAKENWGIGVDSKGVPLPESVLYLISKGEIKQSWEYGSGKMLKEADYTYEQIISKVNVGTSKFYMTSKSYLDNSLIGQENQTFSIEYIWNFCGDCLYANPNMLWKHSNWNKEDKIYIVDIGDLTFNEQGQFDKTNPTYVEYLNEHHLSYESDNTYGYSGGKVPTIQHYTNGVLDDSIVIFNDEYSLIEEESLFKITNSFFDDERPNKAKYLSGVSYESLIGKKFRNTGHEEIASYYERYLEAYLNFYH